METPRVALRFRDASPNINTIAEHRAMIGARRGVWWGWWKKESEDAQEHAIAALRQSPGDVLLIDRSTRRCFRAHYERAVKRGEAIDVERIPEYYRDATQRVAAWFLLTIIEDAEYPDDIARRLGEHTLLELMTPHRNVAPSQDRREVACLDRTTILHLSDLHFGADYAFVPPGAPPGLGGGRELLTTCIKRDLERVGMLGEIAFVLVTGDFTTRGDWSDCTRQQVLSEFAELRSALGLQQQHFVAVTGNHDVVRYPPGRNISVEKIAVQQQTTMEHERNFRLFVEELTGRRWNEPLFYCQDFVLRDVDVSLCVLDSCRITATDWTEYGYVGTGGLDVLGEIGARPLRRGTYRVLALHHHLLPVNRFAAPSSAGVSLVLDAVDVLDAAQNAGIHLAIHGHQHLPRVTKYARMALSGDRASEGMIIASGGSAGVIAERRPVSERNTYSLFRFDARGVKLWIRELRNDAKLGASLFEGELPLRPTAP